MLFILRTTLSCLHLRVHIIFNFSKKIVNKEILDGFQQSKILQKMLISKARFQKMSSSNYKGFSFRFINDHRKASVCRKMKSSKTCICWYGRNPGYNNLIKLIKCDISLLIITFDDLTPVSVSDSHIKHFVIRRQDLSSCANIRIKPFECRILSLKYT